MTPALPYLAPWYRIATGEDRVVLEYGQRMVCLEGRAAGRLLPALLPLLDGTRTVDEVVRALGEPARPAVERALAELTAHGILLDGPPLPADVPRPISGTVELLTSLHSGRTQTTQTADALAACSVAVVGNGPVGLEVARLLRTAGIAVDRAQTIASDFDLMVCAPDPAELPLLRCWNEQALDRRRPWLQVLPFNGHYAALGPLYLPGDTCCYECFSLRRAANLDAADELPLLEQAPAAYPGSPALDAAAGGLAALLVLEWLVLGNHFTPAAFYALGLLPVLSLSVHHVHRVPRCPACSGVADVAPPLPWYKETPVAHG